MIRSARTLWKRRHRSASVWLLVAFIATQVPLAIWIDQSPSAVAVRDPEYVLLRDMLRERIAERPDVPVAVFIGSSRVAHGFDAARATGSEPVVLFNFGVPGSGPYLQDVLLDRLRTDGVKPDVLFIEVLHSFYNSTGERSLDHSLLDGARLSFDEARDLWTYSKRSTGPMRRWVYARGVPINRHQAELRELIGLDRFRPGEGPAPPFAPIEPTGYRPKTVPEKEWEERTKLARKQYGPFYRRFELDPQPWGRLERMIDRARGDGTEVVVILMPEGTEFRSQATAEMEAGVAGLVARLTTEKQVRVIDARAWLPDSGFYDQHHMLPEGATRFADRFRNEALRPILGGPR